MELTDLDEVAEARKKFADALRDMRRKDRVKARLFWLAMRRACDRLAEDFWAKGTADDAR